MSGRHAMVPLRRPMPVAVRLATILAALATGVAAADDDVVAGIGGVYRNGFWTPLLVRSAGDGGPARAWVEDADGRLVGSPPPSGGRLCVRPGRPQARMAIAPPSAAEGEAPAIGMAPRPIPGTSVPSTTPLLLVHGDLPAAASAARLVAGGRTPMQVVRLSDGAVPPALTPRDLDGFDAAIVCGDALGTLAPDTLQAVDGWTRSGGRLIVIAGESAATVASGGGVAAGWLPGTDPELVTARRFGGLEAFARAGGLGSRLPRQGARVPRFAVPADDGSLIVSVEADPDDLPLVVRRGHGFGTVTWLGLDLDTEGIRSWPGCDRLLAALLGDRGDVDAAKAAAPAARPRVPDLAGQLRVALDTLPATDGGSPTAAVPFEVVAGMGLAYVLALYPLDWWLVNRCRRPAVSWVTLPLLAGGFTAAAWAVGGRWGRDLPARCLAAEVLDIDAAGRFVRGSSWIAVRSPVNATLDLGIAAASPFNASDAAVSWFADAGRGFGAVDAATAHPTLAAADYRYTDSLASLVGVPVAAASSRLFEAEWTGETAAPPVTSSLTRDARGLLHGSVSHHLDFRLTRCRLLHGGWLYDAGDLEPGQPFDTAAGRGPRSLAAALAPRRTAVDRDQTLRWDATAVEPALILEMAGFHAAAGGPGYTLLDGGRLARLDLSPLLTVDRAILVGIAPADRRGTSWRVSLRSGGGTDGLRAEAADGGTLVRLVIPLPTARHGGGAEESR